MLNKTYALFLLFGLFLFCGCEDDDGGNSIPLTYDPATTIYGTLLVGLSDAWEVVIDPVSGQVDSIPGTGNFQRLNFPLGPRFYQRFSPDQRFFINIDNELVLQNLQTFQYEAFSFAGTERFINPQFVTGIPETDELIILDTDQSVWRADIATLTVEEIIEDITPQGRTAVYVFPLGDNQYIQVFGDGSGERTFVRSVDVVDLNTETVLDFLDLEESSFGLVRQDGTNSFFFLARSASSQGFRLGRLEWDGSNITTAIISPADLAIDGLAPQRQTIHTATNSFIAISPTGNIENSENTLHRIDLTTGELLGSVALDLGGTLLKIAGE